MRPPLPAGWRGFGLGEKPMRTYQPRMAYHPRMASSAYLERRSQSLLTMGLIGLLVAGFVAFAGVVLGGNARNLILFACFGAGALLTAISLKDWRAGVPIFFVWIVLEDLARKY